MTVRLHLLCHASTAATRSGSFSADEPVDDFGRRKLDAYSRNLPRAGRHLTSPARRARETAAALGFEAPLVDCDLRDCDFGRWSGRSLDAIASEDGAGLERWRRDPDAASHGGESIADLIARVARWLASHASDPGQIVAVTHPAVIRAAIVAVMDAPPSAFWQIDVAPLDCALLKGRVDGSWLFSSLSKASVS